MNKKELESYRKKLLAKKKEIVNQLSEFHNATINLDPGVAQDVGDKAESSYTKEFLLSLSDAERAQLGLIDQALKRIDRSGFGTCTNCGNTIKKKRLDVIPWAPFCITCQLESEAKS